MLLQALGVELPSEIHQILDIIPHNLIWWTELHFSNETDFITYFKNSNIFFNHLKCLPHIF